MFVCNASDLSITDAQFNFGIFVNRRMGLR